MHSMDNIISAYQNAVNLENAPIVIVSEVFWALIGLALLVHVIKDRKTISFAGYLFRGLFFVVVLLVNGYLINMISHYDYSVDLQSWKSTYLLPYVEARPEQRVAVKDFSQLLSNEDQTIDSIHLKKESHTVLARVRVGNPATSKVMITKVLIKKEQINKAYLSYKMIPRKISEDYSSKDYYETTLHIPAEYKVIESSH